MGSEKLNFSSFDVEEALTSFPGVNDSVGFFCLCLCLCLVVQDSVQLDNILWSREGFRKGHQRLWREVFTAVIDFLGVRETSAF